MTLPSADSGRPNRESHRSFWVRDLPFCLVLALIVIGVAYTSFSNQPIVGYWELLVPLIGLLCIGAGWHHASDSTSRWKLIATQGLHWLAFLVVMNLMLLPGVQRQFNAISTGMAIFTLLTLGTFTAGVHVLSWHVCLLGLIMAFGIPAIAWIQNSALFAVLVGAAIFALAAVAWWRWRERKLTWKAAHSSRSEGAGPIMRQEQT